MKILLPLLACVALSAQAGVLDYSVQGPPVLDDTGRVSAAYGDVAGLVDVTHAYINGDGQASDGLLWWGTGYDDLAGVAWNGSEGGGDHGRVTLASVGGSLVSLNGFDLGIWGGGHGVDETVTIHEIGNPVALQTYSFQETANQHWSFTVGLQSTSGFVIEWTSPWWVAIDNLDSTAAAVPEPASLLTMLGGLAALALTLDRRRRRA